MDFNLTEYRIKNLFDWLDKVSGTNIKEKIASGEKNWRGSFASYNSEKHMFKAYADIQRGDFAAAAVRLAAHLERFLSEVCVGKEVSYKSVMEVSDALRRGANELELIREDASRLSLDRVEKLREIGWIRDEVNEKDAKDVVTAISDVRRNLISSPLNVLALNNSTFERKKSFRVAGSIIMSDSIHELLKTIKPATGEECLVHLLLKIEPRVEFSYFLIAFASGDSLRIVTDQIHFDNPNQMFVTRTGRRSEEREDKLVFPYILIDKIIEWRKEEKGLTTEKEAERYTELYIKPLEDYVNGLYRPVFMSMVQQIYLDSDFNAAPLALPIGTMFSNLRLLTAEGQESLNAEFKCKLHKKELEAWYEETFGDVKCNLPVKVITDVAAIPNFNQNLLVTQAEAEQTLMYYKAKAEADFVRKQCNDYYKANGEADAQVFRKLVNEKFDRVARFFFAGHEVSFCDVDNARRLGWGFDAYNEIILDYMRYHEEDNWRGSFIFHNHKHQNNSCLTCGKEVQKPFHSFVNFSWWREMCFVLGVSRDELPRTFRSFYSNSHKPYVGNSILDDVDPRFDLDDPLSDNYPNGVRVPFQICGRCKSRYVKQHFIAEKVCFIYSSKRNELLETVDLTKEGVNIKNIVEGYISKSEN